METRSCLFKNMCYEALTSQWLYHLDPDTISTLPTYTTVNKEGIVSWSTTEPFQKNWAINLATTYQHDKSQFEAHMHRYTFRPVTVPTFIPKDIIWEMNPYMLFARTSHDDNVGHLVYEQYHPLLTTIETHLGLEWSRNVTLIDHVANNGFHSRYWPGFYEQKWKYSIGRLLFKNEIRIKQFRKESKNSSQMICYRKLIIGCGHIAGLEGGVLHRPKSIRYIRTSLWNEYARGIKERLDADNNILHRSEIIDTLWYHYGTKIRSLSSALLTPVSTPPSLSPSSNNTKSNKKSIIKILMLQKTASNWNHMNIITNWETMITEIKKIQYVDVINIVPQNTNFSTQVVLYKEADIVISLWGGISMLNFLISPGSVEILLTAWFAPLMPFPNDTWVNKKQMICPDFDDRARLSLGDTKSVRFCSATNGSLPITVNITNFIPLVELVVKNQLRRW